MSEHDDEVPFRFGSKEDAPPPPERPWGRWLLLLVLLMVVAGAGVYLYWNPLHAPEWLQETKLLPKAAPTVVYKWRDAAGAWHITDAPPPEGTAFERLEYQHDTNVLPLPPQLQPKD
jgi:hypothetical protein